MKSEWNVKPTREEVREKAESGKNLNSRDIFVAKCRSFVYPVEFLKKLKGPNEYDKRDIVQNFYCWCREVDEAEDGKFPIGTKKNVLAKIGFIVNEVARKGFGDTLDDLINGDSNLPYVTRNILAGVDKSDLDTYLFVKHFGKGPVLRDMHNFRNDVQNILSTYIGKMAYGMSDFIQRRKLKTEEDLLAYVHYVAEQVGMGLNDVIKTVDNVELNMERGKAVARFLQLTNIGRNIKEDEEARSDDPDSRILFLPTDWYPNINSNELMYGENGGVQKMRVEVFRRLEELARSSLPDTVKYIEDIPQWMTGYLGFLYGSVVPGIENWELMSEYGAEEVFKGNQNAVKLDRKTRFANIIRFGLRIVPSGRTIDFLHDYSTNPGKYTFKSDGFEKWSGKYFSGGNYKNGIVANGGNGVINKRKNSRSLDRGNSSGNKKIASG